MSAKFDATTSISKKFGRNHRIVAVDNNAAAGSSAERTIAVVYRDARFELPADPVCQELFKCTNLELQQQFEKFRLEL